MTEIPSRQSPTNRAAGWPQAVTLIALGTLPTMAIAALVAVLPTFFVQFGHVPHKEVWVPMILTVPSLCVALFSWLVGAAADRWGRRPVLLLALLVFTFFGVLPMAFDNLYAIIASRFFVGVAEAAILSVGNALMGDYFHDARRQHWLGWQMSVGPFVASGYILLGGLLASWSWHAPFLTYLLGAPVLVAAALVLFEPAHSPAGATPAQASLAAPGVASAFPWRTTFAIGGVTLLVSVIYFLQAVQHGRIFSELGVATPGRISLIVTLASAGTVVGGYWFKQSGPRPVGLMLALALACYGVSYVGISLSTDYRMGLPFDAVGQFAGGYVLPTLIAWALSKYDYQHRGRGMGIWAACFFLGQFLNPPVMTLIAHGSLSFLQSTGVLGGFCLVAALVWAWRGRRSGVVRA